MLLTTLLCSQDVNVMVKNGTVGDLPGGPVAENLPYSAGDGTRLRSLIRELRSPTPRGS